MPQLYVLNLACNDGRGVLTAEFNRPHALDSWKRAGISMVLVKASAVMGPTPGITVKRLQVVSSLVIVNTFRCSERILTQLPPSGKQ